MSDFITELAAEFGSSREFAKGFDTGARSMAAMAAAALGGELRIPKAILEYADTDVEIRRIDDGGFVVVLG